MSDYSSLAPSSPFEGSTFKIPNSQFMFGAFCRFEAEDVVQPARTEEEDDARGNFGEVGPLLGQRGGFPSLSRVDPSRDDGTARSCCHPNYHTHTSLSTYCTLQFTSFEKCNLSLPNVGTHTLSTGKSCKLECSNRL